MPSYSFFMPIKTSDESWRSETLLRRGGHIKFSTGECLTELPAIKKAGKAEFHPAGTEKSMDGVSKNFGSIKDGN